MDPQHDRAEVAAERMDSELDAIQERLRALKRKLDARVAVIAVDGDEVPGAPGSARHREADAAGR